MEKEDKKLAEAVLRRLCQGAQIDGLRFGPILQILITDHTSDKPPVSGQICLNLASRWAVFPALPAALPGNEAEIAEMSIEEQLQTLCALRERTIADIHLGEEQPHLLLHLDNGSVFFLCGRDDRYEPWQLGVAYGNPQELWMIVATLGGGVAVWSPWVPEETEGIE